MSDNSAQRLLDVRSLSVRFGRQSVVGVDDVSFGVGRERVGIVGESGSGKSTVGRAIMRLLPKTASVDAAAIRLEETELTALPEREMRRLRGREIALIMQDPRYSLNPVMPIGKQVAEAGRLHLALTRSEARQEARAMLEKVRIPDVGHVMSLYPHQISGGMGQRVMISMMLLSKPKLVIADEPTSALDVSVRRSVLDLLRSLTEENGSGLVLISHDIRMVAAFCSRILVMYKGRLVEELRDLAQASHPYTRALIASIPDQRQPQRRLPTIDRAKLQEMFQ